VICLLGDGFSLVQHYYNAKKNAPVLLDESNPTVGLSNSSIAYKDNFMSCSFKRAKANENVEHYFNLSKKFNILMAHGRLEGSNLNYYAIRSILKYLGFYFYYFLLFFFVFVLFP
jgi:hypothetical protein